MKEMDRRIGMINGLESWVELGQSDEDAPCYKNPHAFESQDGRICYIPENGVTTEVSMLRYCLKDADTFTYRQLRSIACEFVDKHTIHPPDYEVVNEWTQALFDALQWQHPTTIIDEWIANGVGMEDD